jgi:chromosome segregation protein
MDEIDESLDPQNRERVANLLRKFSKDSQMIVVTLYDTIAAAADRVFGVIKEDGVSRVLSVELSGLGG